MRFSDMCFDVTVRQEGAYHLLNLRTWLQESPGYYGISPGALWLSWQEGGSYPGEWYAFDFSRTSSTIGELEARLRLAKKVVPEAQGAYSNPDPKDIIMRLLRNGATYVIEDKRSSQMLLPGDVPPDGYHWYYALPPGGGSNTAGHVYSQPWNAKQSVHERLIEIFEERRYWAVNEEYIEEWVAAGRPINFPTHRDRPDCRPALQKIRLFK